MADYMPIREEARLRKAFPGAFAVLNRAGADNPLDAMEALLPYLREIGVGVDDALDDAFALYANWLWQQHRVVYSVDGDLFRELVQGGLRAAGGDPLPVELLENLPFPCIAVETAPFRFFRHGTTDALPIQYTGKFYIYATRRGVLTEGRELCVVAEVADARNVGTRFPSYSMPLVGTLEASVETLQARLEELGQDNVTREGVNAEIAVCIAGAQIVLYLQSVGADMQHRPTAPRKKKARTSGAPVQKPPKVWDVGVRIGATLRAGAARSPAPAAEGTGTPKRPHSRRGHFHSYWTGPKDGERQLVVKWTAPTFIHADDAQAGAVVHRVK